MRYLIHKAIYHLSFFEKAVKEGGIDMDPSSLFDGISAVYCLTEKEKRELLSYRENEDFNQLQSASTLRFHLEFLDHMDFQTGLFGARKNEREVLFSKLEALEYYERLQNGDRDLIGAFERNLDKKRVAVSFALLHNLKHGKVPDRLIAELRKNASARDACDFDSLILLFKADSKNRKQYQCILQKSSFAFYSEDYERLSQTYFNEGREDA